MRIRQVHSWVEELELSRPYSIAYAHFDRATLVFVRIETDDGLVALGNGTPVERITGENLADCAAAAARLDSLLRGEDPRHLRRLLRRLDTALPNTPAARAAADIALHDLYARQFGLPLVDLLGRAHDSLPTSITLGIQGLEETLEETREYLGRGFRCLKLKIGADLDQDLATLEALRAEAGPAIGIRVDANQGYQADQLPAFYRRARELDVELVEQPLAIGKSGEMLKLEPAERAISAADESLQSPADALRLATDPSAFGVFNIKLMKCGGVAPACAIASIAEIGGIDLMWGCMDESVVSITAALHAALASPATRFLDLDGSFDLARDLARGGFELSDGQLRTLDRPGLGVELLEEGP